MFVIYEDFGDLVLPVTHFDTREEAEQFIVEDCCDNGLPDERWLIEEQDEEPDYLAV